MGAHAKITVEIVKKAIAAADNENSRCYTSIARGLLDLALQSDQFWWASRRPNWDINLIHRGLIQQHEALLNGYKAISACTSLSEKEKREYHYKEVAARDVRSHISDRLFSH